MEIPTAKIPTIVLLNVVNILRRVHAADVLRNLHVIITRGGLKELMTKRRMLASGAQQQELFDSEDRGSACSSASMLTKAEIITGSGMKRVRIVQGRKDDATLSRHQAVTLLAMYLSAVIHDHDHRGVTNPFLIQDQDPIAVRTVRRRQCLGHVGAIINRPTLIFALPIEY